MKRLLGPCALLAVWVVAWSASAQGVRTDGACSPIVDRTLGSVTINLACTAGITPAQLQQITDAVRSGQTVPAEFLTLSQTFGVTENALKNFFRILGERKVDTDDLDARLREIAERHRNLLKQLESVPGSDPQVDALKRSAVAAIEAGNHAEAETLLEKAFDADLEAARKAKAAAEKALEIANRRFVAAAQTKSDKGLLKLSQLQYAAAAKEFLAAADLVPANEQLLRAQYLASGGSAWFRAGAYPLAGTMLVEALRIREKLLPAEHTDVASSLTSLALLYRAQNRLTEAEPLYKRALAISEKTHGADVLSIAAALSNLAVLYQVQGRYAEAEPLYKRALAINEKAHGPEHPDVATDLSNLAALARAQGRFAEAEPLAKRALAIDEAMLGPEHPNVAIDLNNLAVLYRAQGRNAEAEPLYKRALAIGEKTLGPGHPAVANRLNNLAVLYSEQGRYAEAEPLAKRALAISQKALGPEHPDVATRLDNLAVLYRDQRQYAEAEPLAKRALAIREKALGAEHPDVAIGLNNLAALYRAQGRNAEALPLYRRTLAIREKALGADHPNTAAVRRDLQTLQQSTPPASDAPRPGQGDTGGR